MTPQRLIDRPIAGTGAPTRRPLRRVGNVMAGCRARPRSRGLSRRRGARHCRPSDTTDG
jgi:hypothetical protein